jgi:hypothetical protein
MVEETEVDFASRLTLKDLGVDSKKALKGMAENQSKVAIARMYGVVSRVGFQEDRNTSQTYTYFVGSFEGVNLQDGTVIQSSKMYLPEGASQTLEHIVNQIHQRRGKGATVHFAFEIRLTKNADAKAGYVYETAAILKPEHTDQLATVRDIVVKATQPKAEAGKDAGKEVRKSA